MWLTEKLRITGPLVMLLSMASMLHACETPVYQYSMYEWAADLYRVRYFHDGGATDPADAEANDLLRSAAPANVGFASVEVAADGSVAPEHAGAWADGAGGDLPLHVVTAPGGGVIFTGRLNAEAVGELLDSPRRSELANQLSQGRAGILLVLVDYDAEDAERVLRVARSVAEASSHEGRTVGLVEVNRTDPAERWLVQQLLAVEPDLPELSGSMVFGALGRGRVVPPFVGAGVTAQGLRELIAFIHGPCACDVKAANPGLDLLMNWNWVERLPQWAAGSVTQPHFMLFDFQVDPEAEGTRPASPGNR